jgi:uncharacterized protein YcbK (DUF882 family)
MRRILLVAFVLLSAVPASASDYCSGNLCFQKKARVTCLKPEVWGILHKVSARIGALEITSGCDGKHARHSHHYAGRAVDFRPIMASSRAALAILHSLPEVGGIGSYANGLVHADIGQRRFAWHGQQRVRTTHARGARTRLAMGRS